jgi:hypothetical protein
MVYLRRRFFCSTPNYSYDAEFLKRATFSLGEVYRSRLGTLLGTCSIGIDMDTNAKTTNSEAWSPKVEIVRTHGYWPSGNSKIIHPVAKYARVIASLRVKPGWEISTIIGKLEAGFCGSEFKNLSLPKKIAAKQMALKILAPVEPSSVLGWSAAVMNADFQGRGAHTVRFIAVHLGRLMLAVDAAVSAFA